MHLSCQIVLIYDVMVYDYLSFKLLAGIHWCSSKYCFAILITKLLQPHL